MQFTVCTCTYTIFVIHCTNFTDIFVLLFSIFVHYFRASLRVWKLVVCTNCVACPFLLLLVISSFLTIIFQALVYLEYNNVQCT